ncbi:TIGR00645 family protein [Candidatus Raskinella chloraquaticus]|jgi:uncharacterized protein (TIGR00645 family)|uniref:UPF0114 protein A4S15_10100 n=1 Tax=Candidatus Raskinella chloraquaticus TaxID=1951219 RepID=A0A1W9HWM1_9HYPH|nr:MAG: hypothetical protein A4S15_10100 [Proteobacteria bacterium SG_bin8]
MAKSTTDPEPSRSRAPASTVEAFVENALFMSRWLLAPIYLGLVLGTLALLIIFARELFELFHLAVSSSTKAESIILVILSLIDISLAANLVMIVTFAGYENFVSKMDIEDHPDRPAWLGKIDFGGLKLKLVASIAAISAIQLLKVFVTEANLSSERIYWMIVIHITFVMSGVLLAIMDYITAKSKALGYEGD